MSSSSPTGLCRVMGHISPRSPHIVAPLASEETLIARFRERRGAALFGKKPTAAVMRTYILYIFFECTLCVCVCFGYIRKGASFFLHPFLHLSFMLPTLQYVSVLLTANFCVASRLSAFPEIGSTEYNFIRTSSGFFLFEKPTSPYQPATKHHHRH